MTALPKRFQRPVTPGVDQPKTKRAYPLAVKPAGPALPVYGGGPLGSQRRSSPFPVFGSMAPQRPFARIDLRTDVRREVDE